MAGRTSDLACGTCRHFDGRNPDDMFCRAHPATVVVIRENRKDVVRRFYPPAHPVLDWCGEHEVPAS